MQAVCVESNKKFDEQAKYSRSLHDESNEIFNAIQEQGTIDTANIEAVKFEIIQDLENNEAMVNTIDACDINKHLNIVKLPNVNDKVDCMESHVEIHKVELVWKRNL